MEDNFSIKKGQKFQVRSNSIDLLGIIEQTNERVELPIRLIGKEPSHKALDDEKDGYVLVMKRKIIEIEEGRRAVANVYIKSSHISPIK